MTDLFTTRSATDTVPLRLHRMMEVALDPMADGETRAGGEENELIPISMSSEARVERYDWWTGERYFEVLSHEKGGVDLTYARDGLPFLMDHDTRIQVGIVENVKLDGKAKVIRGAVRMGNHPNAEWLGKDLRGGIRKKVSVGYDPGNNYRQIEGDGEKIPTRIYTGWRLYEASSVPVPADYDVGVMRSAFEGSPRGEKKEKEELPHSSREAKETTMSGTPEKGAAPTADGAGTNGTGYVAPTRDYDAERKQRNHELGQLARAATNLGLNGAELLSEAIQKDMTPAEFGEVLYKASAERAANPVPAGRVNMSDKEQREYSVVRAMREVAQSKLEGRPIRNSIEFEVSRSIAEGMGTEPKGIYIPLSLTANGAAADVYRQSVGMRTAVTGNVAGTTSLGGVGVATEVTSMIELLRNSLVTRQAGIRTMDGLTGNILFPRQTAAKADSAATTDSFTLSPKTGYGATAYSKQLLVQASFSVEQWVREDLASIAAQGIDLAVLHGLGSANQPTGIFVLGSTGSVLFATDGLAPTWAKIVEFETTMETNNALQGQLAYISSPGIRGYLKTNLKNTVSGSDYLIGDSGRLNGYNAFFTNQIRTNFTAGTSTTIAHGVVFGNWSEGILASWGDALDVTVDPYKYLDQGMVRVVESAMVDVGFRHPKSFVVATSALTS
jgi:HK97 family phage major capsid protein